MREQLFEPRSVDSIGVWKMILTTKPALQIASEPVAALTRRMVARMDELWWECETTLPDLGETVTPRRQRENERLVSETLDRLTSELKRLSPDPASRRAARDRILADGFALARDLFGFDERQLDVIRRNRFLEASEDFARMARLYDPAIRGEDIYQASRNVMTMNFVQLLLGLPVTVTPAVFAYSMLYPYTDNYLDNPAVPPEAKAGFTRRFRARLAGEEVVPANPQEQRIWDLVERVEAQWPRYRNGEIYESLLGIHDAQSRSLRQQRGNASPYEVDVLRTSFEKGGTSVLADGYLIAGALDEGSAEFFFGYGAFTQLMDDLEDIESDRKAGYMTIFSQTAGHWPLDAVTNRAMRFGQRIFAATDRFPVPDAAPLRGMILRALGPLLSVSAAGAAGYYTRDYLRELEAHMPVRFTFLRDQRKKLERNKVSLVKLIE